MRERLQAWNWRLWGKQGLTPHFEKRARVKDFAIRHGIDTFVETGTYLGDMVYAVKNVFRRIVSIEFNEALWVAAVERFRDEPHIQVLQGDSGDVLPGVVASLDRPCLFWLDAHYSGGLTGKSRLCTPILAELLCIFSHPIRNHVVLIDDARCFTGRDDYPTVGQIKELVSQHRPEWRLSIEDDIICASPAR